MVPHKYDLMVLPHMYDMIFRTALNVTVKYGPLTLYGTGIVWSPTCAYGPPHVKYLHVLYDCYGPHTLYRIGIIWSLT